MREGKYKFNHDYIKNEFENNKEYYYLGFQCIDSYITKIVYSYLSEYNSVMKFCCDFTLLQKIIKKILSKEYFISTIKEEEKYIYSLIGAIIFDSDNEQVILDEINDIYKVEHFLLKIYKKEENKYLLVNSWLKKKGFECITSYTYSNVITCTCNINNIYYVKEENTLLKAKYGIYEEIYEYLIENNLYYNISDVVGVFDINTSIDKLEELYQKGYIKKPNYIFIDHDNFEEIKYEVRCSIENISFYSVKIHNTKEKAKQLCAYSMLQMIVDQL
ncbi:MAG: double-stranded RNA binding motif domain-containing protein [bacterium]